MDDQQRLFFRLCWRQCRENDTFNDSRFAQAAKSGGEPEFGIALNRAGRHFLSLIDGATRSARAGDVGQECHVPYVLLPGRRAG